MITIRGDGSEKKARGAREDRLGEREWGGGEGEGGGGSGGRGGSGERGRGRGKR